MTIYGALLAVILITVLITPNICKAKPTPSGILSRATAQLNNLNSDLSQSVNLSGLRQYIDNLTQCRDEISKYCIFTDGVRKGELLPAARPIDDQLSSEIQWMSWVVNQMTGVQSANIIHIGDTPLSDTKIYPAGGTMDHHTTVGWGGSASYQYTFVTPNPSGTGTAGSLMDCFWNANGWAYSQLYNLFMWTGASHSKDVSFVGSYKGVLFASGGTPGTMSADIYGQYYIIEINTAHVTRVTFYARTAPTGTIIVVPSTAFNQYVYNYYMTHGYIYNMGVKFQASSSAWIGNAFSNFAHDNYNQLPYPAKWYLQFINLHQ